MEPKEMIGLCSGEQRFVQSWRDICLAEQAKLDAWRTMLRANDVKAAHPDDGWVDRVANIVTMCYPQFDDGVRAGDVIALGSPSKHRLVRVTGQPKPRAIMHLTKHTDGPRL